MNALNYLARRMKILFRLLSSSISIYLQKRISFILLKIIQGFQTSKCPDAHMVCDSFRYHKHKLRILKISRSYCILPYYNDNNR